MKAFKAVIFDCDGVMFDTAGANRAFYNKILSHMGKPYMTDEDFYYVNMYTVEESLVYLFKEPAEIEKATAFKKRMGYKEFIPEMEMEPYLKRLLSKIRPYCKTAVATNRTDTMEDVVNVFELNGLFDAVVCASDVRHAKPRPDMLELAAERVGVDICDALYIGDSEVDEKAASAAGMTFIAFGNETLKAWKHIKGFNELEKIILS